MLPNINQICVQTKKVSIWHPNNITKKCYVTILVCWLTNMVSPNIDRKLIGPRAPSWDKVKRIVKGCKSQQFSSTNKIKLKGDKVHKNLISLNPIYRQSLQAIPRIAKSTICLKFWMAMLSATVFHGEFRTWLWNWTVSSPTLLAEAWSEEGRQEASPHRQEPGPRFSPPSPPFLVALEPGETDWATARNAFPVSCPAWLWGVIPPLRQGTHTHSYRCWCCRRDNRTLWTRG